VTNSVKLCKRLENLVSSHEDLKRTSISLVPTENVLSPKAARLLRSDLANRYYLTDNTIWEYPQISHMKKISDICEYVFKKLYNVKYVNIRPLSGINCLTILLASLTQKGQILFSMHPNCGGHGATRKIAERLGLTCHYLPYDYSNFDLDYEECEKAFKLRQPDFIYVDMSNSLFTIDLTKLAGIAPKGAFVHYDSSQIMGLALDGDYFNPIKYGLKLLAGSTHKTFPGPQHGVIMSDDADIMASIEMYTNSFVSNHHMNNVASLAMSAIEMLEFGTEYSNSIRRNAVALGEELIKAGVPVVSCEKGVTLTHQVWINTEKLKVDAHKIVARLEQNKIITNCVRLPLSSNKMLKGIRIGTTEVSRRGMGTAEMGEISQLIAKTIFQTSQDSVILREVESLAEKYSTPKYCF
jgi:glycine hydroxymethyltransferase